MTKSKKIKLDEDNVRVHDDANQNAINKSLKNLGTGRSVLVDANNILIAGNGVFEQAKKLKIPVKIIESDGKELIAIKRTDLKNDSGKRKALAIADNKANDMSFFDFDKLKTELEQLSDIDFDLELTGFQDFELGFLDNFPEGSIISDPKGSGNTIDVEPGSNEYHDMPAYNQENIDKHKLIIHFRSMQDKMDFASLIQQKIQETTKALWHPEAKNIDEKNHECKAK